jgi:hypothetical protein
MNVQFNPYEDANIFIGTSASASASASVSQGGALSFYEVRSCMCAMNKTIKQPDDD